MFLLCTYNSMFKSIHKHIYLHVKKNYVYNVSTYIFFNRIIPLYPEVAAVALIHLKKSNYFNDFANTHFIYLHTFHKLRLCRIMDIILFEL